MKNKISIVGATSFVALLWACSSIPGVCDDPGSCQSDAGVPPDGTSSGGESGIDAPPGCDLAKEPKDSPACVDDAVGVFVDATSGSDGNPGSKIAPFKTLGVAIAKAGDKPRVYICDGSYSESVKLAPPNAPSLYGGFACGSWSYASTKPKVAPTGVGYALEIDGVASEVIVSDLAFASREGTTMGASSIAAFVSSGAKVTILRTVIEAARGREGEEGLPGTTGTITAVSSGSLDANGNAATGAIAGPQKICTCSSGGTSTGGAGGGPMGAGAPGFPALGGGAPGAGAGTGCSVAEPNGSGDVGGDATAAADAPALAANAFGTLTASGWLPRPGASGPNGSPGQGGGGGAGRDATSAGGGGACGGCGGSGGKGGTGGGASVALLVLDSTIVLRGSTLITKAGGVGGRGGAGGPGATTGGTAANGGAAGCSSGEGGKGGAGGTGGGGAGGLSVGVLYRGPKPTLEASGVTAGALGPKGQGGTPGVNDGIDGIAADTLEVP